MKNPFVKENKSVAWIAAAATDLIAGAAVWYIVKRAINKPENYEHALDYLQPAPILHKKKTDLADLHSIATN